MSQQTRLGRFWDFPNAEETKDMVNALEAVKAAKKALIVLPEKDDVIYRSEFEL